MEAKKVPVLRRWWRCDDCDHVWFGYKTCTKCGSHRVGLERDPRDEYDEQRW